MNIMLIVLGLFVVGGATAAFAWHSVCQTGAGVGTGDLTPDVADPKTWAAQVRANNLAATPQLGVCVQLNDPSSQSCYGTECGGCGVGAICHNVQLFFQDPNTASVGKTFTLASGGTLTGTLPGVGATGAEAGTVTPGGVDSLSVSGTTVYVNGTPTGVAPVTYTKTGTFGSRVNANPFAPGARICTPVITVSAQGIPLNVPAQDQAVGSVGPCSPTPIIS